jgi:hypothetical protein
VKPAAGSGSPAAAGSGSAVAPAGHKLTIALSPAEVVTTAKIQVDGKDITGASIDLPVGKESVKVSVTAPGYHTQDSTVDVSGGDTTVKFTLQKRAAQGSPGFGGASSPGQSGHPSNTTPANPGKGKGGGGGLIDI